LGEAGLLLWESEGELVGEGVTSGVLPPGEAEGELVDSGVLDAS